MTNRQIAKQKVIRAALATLLENKALWENLPGMVKDVDALEAVKAELETGTRNQAAATSLGATKAQQASRSELRRLVRSAGRLLARHADHLGSTELAGNARVNDEALQHSSLMNVVPEARRVEALVQVHPEAFVGSAKDPEFAKTLSEAIAAFEAVMGKPRLVVVTRAVATKQVEKAVREGRRLLVRLDALVVQFDDEAPAFVTAWKHALKGRAPQPQTVAEAEPEIVSTTTPTPAAKAA